jgi:hypothetical protein
MIMPSVCKYILWAVVNNEGPYKKKEEKVNLIFDEGYLAFPKDHSDLYGGTILVKGIDFQEKNFLDVIEKQVFYDSEASTKDLAKSISNHLQIIEEHKSKFIKDVNSLEELLQREVFGRMSVEAIDIFTQWIDDVIPCPNLH